MGKLDWLGFVHTCLFYIPPTLFAWLFARAAFALFGVSHPASWQLGLLVIPVWMVSVLGWMAIRISWAQRNKV